MPKVTFIQPDSAEIVVDAHIGSSAMHTALTNGITGIVADCGGAASCATCHVYVDEAWLDAVGPAGDDEADMLDCTASERLPNSRLSCQIEITEDLEGLVLRIPENQ